jgi:hypothetical protein
MEIYRTIKCEFVNHTGLHTIIKVGNRKIAIPRAYIKKKNANSIEVETKKQWFEILKLI